MDAGIRSVTNEIICKLPASIMFLMGNYFPIDLNIQLLRCLHSIVYVCEAALQTKLLLYRK